MRDGYLVIDEIAYMGGCNTTLLESSEEEQEEDRRWAKRKGNTKPKQVKPQMTSTSPPLIPTTTMEVRPTTS